MEELSEIHRNNISYYEKHVHNLSCQCGNIEYENLAYTISKIKRFDSVYVLKRCQVDCNKYLKGTDVNVRIATQEELEIWKRIIQSRKL